MTATNMAATTVKGIGGVGEETKIEHGVRDGSVTVQRSSHRRSGSRFLIPNILAKVRIYIH